MTETATTCDVCGREADSNYASQALLLRTERDTALAEAAALRAELVTALKAERAAMERSYPLLGARLTGLEAG